LLSGFAWPLNRSEWLFCSTSLHMESHLGDNIGVVVLFIGFPKY
jgi:hypothetical protein